MSWLPGWFPGIAAAKLTELTQVASATSTGATIAGPAGIIAGDLLVLLDKANASSIPTAVTPSNPGQSSSFIIPTGGNISIDPGIGNNDTRQIVSYKIADGSEASATITGMDGGTADRKELYVFRGNIPITAVVISPSTINNQITLGNPSSQTVSASAGTPPLVIIGCYGCINGITVTPRTFDPAKDGEINASTDSYLAYKIYNTAPQDTSVDTGDSGTLTALQSFFIACS